MSTSRSFGIDWSEHLILLLCVAYSAVMAVVAPGFFSLANGWNLLFNLIPLLLVAIGQTYVMLTAGIDLSVTSIIALASVAGGYLLSSDYGPDWTPPVAITVGVLAMPLVGAAIGLLNGWAVTRLGMPAFMVTLTTMITVSGLAIWLTASQNIYNLPAAFVDLPYTSVLGVPLPLILGVASVLVSYFILDFTLTGRWLYAVGMNPQAARISGVGVERTIRFAYVFSGACAGLAALFYTARLETGSPVMGQHILLDVIGAVVIGGTSLFGGRGRIHWTVYGVLFIVLLDNSLNLLGLSYFLIMVMKGCVILFAAVLYVLRERAPILSR